MYRIIDIPLSSVAQDCVAASEKVNFAAARRGGRRVTGIGKVNDRLLIFLEPLAAGEQPKHYRFAMLETGASAEEAAAEAKARYYASFGTAGIFEYRDRLWGLFCRTNEE